MIIAGTSSGVVNLWSGTSNLPVGGSTSTTSSLQTTTINQGYQLFPKSYSLHTGSVRHIRSITLDNLVFTAGDDGSLFILAIESGKQVQRKPLDPSRYLDLVLTSRYFLEMCIP